MIFESYIYNLNCVFHMRTTPARHSGESRNPE